MELTKTRCALESRRNIIKPFRRSLQIESVIVYNVGTYFRPFYPEKLWRKWRLVAKKFYIFSRTSSPQFSWRSRIIPAGCRLQTSLGIHDWTYTCVIPTVAQATTHDWLLQYQTWRQHLFGGPVHINNARTQEPGWRCLSHFLQARINHKQPSAGRHNQF